MPRSRPLDEPDSPINGSSQSVNETPYENGENSEDINQTIYKTHPSRFLILFTFSLLSFNQSLFWLTFSPITPQTMLYYSIDQATVNLLLNWGPIFFIPLQFFSSWLSSQKNGLRKTVLTSSTICMLAMVLRLIPNWIWPQSYDPSIDPNLPISHDRQMFETYAIYFLHIAHSLNACAGPLVMSTVSQVSALWFASNERARATSVAVFSNALGSGFGFLQISNQISVANNGNTTESINQSAFEIPRVLYTHMAMSIFAWCLTLAYFPAHPKHPPSHAAKLIIDQSVNQLPTNNHTSHDDQSINQSINDKLSFKASIIETLSSFSSCMKNRSFVCVAFIGGGVTGIFATWTAMFDSILTPLVCTNQSINDICDSNWVSIIAGWIGFTTTLSAVAGGLLMGAIADQNKYQRRFKLLLYVSAILSTLIFCYFILITQSPIFPEPPLSSTVISLAFIIGILGFAVGGISPLVYELGAELTYPTLEHFSAGIIALGNNIFGLIFIFIQPYFDSGIMNLILFGTLIITIFLIIPIKEQYKRRDEDEIRTQSINHSINENHTTDQLVQKHVKSINVNGDWPDAQGEYYQYKNQQIDDEKYGY